jgi:vacuolar-type H+-ATPase subunit D/Vma8
MTTTGRARALHLQRSLEIARRGLHVLDRKQHILASELERLELPTAQSGREWEALAKRAAVWIQRSAALDGEVLHDEVSPTQTATVRIGWGTAMGLSYPNDADCEIPGAPSIAGSSALSSCGSSHRDALPAAVAHAAFVRARLLVSTELAATRSRQRAVENRWIPRLERELMTIRRTLEEQELEDSLRLHWAATTSRARDSTAGSPS